MKFDFDKIPKFCISLERSTERRAQAREEFDRHGLEVKFFEATDKLDLVVPELSPKIHESNAAGILACAQSHIRVIQYAAVFKYPAVCIFEDDVVLCDDFMTRIRYIESLPDFDFDIFSLGGHFSKTIHHDEAEASKWSSIMRVKHHAGTYGLIFTEKTYDFILRNWWYGFGADQFYSDHVYHHFNSYAMVPFLVGHRPGYSEILGFKHTYENVSWQYTQHALAHLKQYNPKK